MLLMFTLKIKVTESREGLKATHLSLDKFSGFTRSQHIKVSRTKNSSVILTTTLKVFNERHQRCVRCMHELHRKEFIINKTIGKRWVIGSHDWAPTSFLRQCVNSYKIYFTRFCVYYFKTINQAYKPLKATNLKKKKYFWQLSHELSETIQNIVKMFIGLDVPSRSDYTT